MFPLILLFGAFCLFSSLVDRSRPSPAPRRLSPHRKPFDMDIEKIFAPSGPSPEEKKATALKARMASLKAQHEPFSHYADSAWLTMYAREHKKWLLDNREDILAEAKKLHEQRIDPAFDEDLTYVLERDEDLYLRMTWKLRVLAVAERLSLDEQEAADETSSTRQLTEQTKRVAELVLEYREFAHYEQQEWIERYANNPQHQQSLLAEREQIIAAHKDLHSDGEFVALLKACAPHIYQRVTWKMRALAAADKLTAEPRRLSEEEKAAKILRYRQRMLDRLNVRAQDEIEKKLQKFELAQQLKERCEDMSLDEDETERLIKEFMGDLYESEEGSGGDFKQL